DSRRAPPSSHSFPTRRSSDLDKVIAAYIFVIRQRTVIGGIDIDKVGLESRCHGIAMARPVLLAVVKNGGIYQPGGIANLFFHARSKSTRLNSSHVKISYAVFC